MNIYKRKDGRYESRYKYLQDGKLKTKYFYAKTKEEIERLIKAFINYLKSEERKELSLSQKTFSEMAKEYIQVKTTEVRINTIGQYTMNINKHILPVVGKFKISEVESKADNLFEEYFNGLEKQLSERTKQDIKRLYYDILNYSKYMVKIYIQENKPDIKFLDAEESKKLLDYLSLPEASNVRVPILLARYVGLRIGEICGLKWSDVDFETSTISVSRIIQRVSLGYSENGMTTKLMILPIKKRIVPLPKKLLALLKESKGNSESFIVTGKATYIEPRTLQYRLNKVKKTNISNVEFSVFRHSFVLDCLNIGINPKKIAEIIGVEIESIIKYIMISDINETEFYSKLNSIF